jgi:hypothetical protein
MCAVAVSPCDRLGRTSPESRSAEQKPCRRTTDVRVNVQNLSVKQADATDKLAISTHLHHAPWGFPEDVETSVRAICRAVRFRLVCLDKNRTFFNQSA